MRAGWYNAENVPVKVTVQANSSAASGIKYWQDTELTTKPDTDGHPGERTTTFDLSTEGKTTIMAVEVDEDGNESEGYATEIIKIDTKIPTTSISQKLVNSQETITDPKGWYKEDVKINIDVTDEDTGVEGSGPDGYEYLKEDGEVGKEQIQKNDWTKVAESKPENPILVTEEGITTYAIRGLDVAGNKSDITTVPIRLDKTEPVFSGDLTITEISTTGFKVKGTATDTWSGSVAYNGSITYTCEVKNRVGDTVTNVGIVSQNEGEEGSFTVTGLTPNGQYEVIMKATDKARKHRNKK